LKKILITGGAGFIGSHLSKRLLNEGNYIICLDNLQTGKKKNIQKLLDNPNFHFVEKDVVESFFYELDEIYNLACPASPPHYQDNPIKTLKTSVIGAINLLELAKINNAKILQASTSEVYGDPIVHPQPETYWGNVNPIGPRSCYDEGKRCAETLFNDYANVFNLKTKIIRIFNTYGPNMCVDDGRVVSNFIIQALKNNDITIYGDGLQTRSFQFVDDLVEGIIRMMNSSDDFRGPVNLGNPFEFTMLDLAKKIIKMTSSNSKLIFLDLPQDDPKMRKPLIDLAYNNLNKWKPEIQLDEGLLSTIEYFKNEIA
jgi:UDP-glucuronate decarboxylase